MSSDGLSEFILSVPPKNFLPVGLSACGILVAFCTDHFNASLPPSVCSSSCKPVHAGGGSCCVPAQKRGLWQLFYPLVCELTQAGLGNSHKASGEWQRVNLFSFCRRLGVSDTGRSHKSSSLLRISDPAGVTSVPGTHRAVVYPGL